MKTMEQVRAVVAGYVAGAAVGQKMGLTDLARSRALVGVHFGRIERAVEQMAAKTLFAFDGVTITRTV